MTLNEANILVQEFEEGTFPKEKWTHRAHFIMALWYTYHEPIIKARSLIKEGIKRYNVTVGGENTDDAGYHETITELYIQIIIQYQLSFVENYTLKTLLNNLDQQKFMKKDFPFQFYSRELLLSKDARKKWIEPDKKGLSNF